MKLFLIGLILFLSALFGFKMGSIHQSTLNSSIEKDDYFLKKITDCSSIKVLDSDMWETTAILDPAVALWGQCLNNPNQWKAILEAKTLTKEQLQFVNDELCPKNKKLDSAKNEWCQHESFHCPVCEVDSYQRLYGDHWQDQLRKDVKMKEENKKKRASFIKKYILKEEN